MATTTVVTEEGLHGPGRDGESGFSSERFSLAHFRGCVLPHSEYL